VTRRRCERGQTTVEFTFLLPALLLFLFAIFSVGITFFHSESLQTAARDGARAASIHTGDTYAEIVQDAKNSIATNATGLDASATGPMTIDVHCFPTPRSPNQLDDQCNFGDVVTVKLTYPWSMGIYDLSFNGTLSTTTTLPME
jgi:Flp pilus assembly protein TadG